ncbi:hypothetical protein RIE95_06075, partial [Acidithiobacillus thiooxidans]|uniref:hypothetical protein n=1 Tax=Acidithiobacillus thiooxidans TaxID=930 RepID=UPI00285BB206
KIILLYDFIGIKIYLFYRTLVILVQRTILGPITCANHSVQRDRPHDNLLCNVRDRTVMWLMNT